MDRYDSLNKAQLSFEYLHTNSTTHTFLFGAIAELIDNSRDAGAQNLDIYTSKDSLLRGGFYLAFLDDGCGMNYDDVFNIIVFGKSAKRLALDSNQIGQYGNGLKSGAMRIANDFILFTKKDNIGTCLLLSRSFHQEEHISQVICPMPCFDLKTRRPIENSDFQQTSGTRNYTFDSAKHQLEMNLILKYSPFKTINEFFDQFNLIKSKSGTLIVLYNVKLAENGDSELDIRTDSKDILIDHGNGRSLFDNTDDNTPLEVRSLRAYASILYYEPRMRITIQHRRVITKRLPFTLYKPRQYQFKSTRFKTRSEQEIKKTEEQLTSLEERHREADSQVHHAQKTIGISTSIEERTRLRKLQIHAAEIKDMIERLRNGLIRKRAELSTTKTLNFIFGLNIQNRAADGVFVYNCGRLIKMYEKIGQPNKKTVYCRGVVGVVDIPSIVLEPTHNKQSFADEKEYLFLMKNIGDYMRQYWSDTGIENYVQEFWETYGYRDDQLDRPPSNEPELVKRRQLAIPMLIQCNQCLKWRRLPYSTNSLALNPMQLETWRCSDNTDVMNNSCAASEKLETIPEGEFKLKTAPTTNPTRTARAVSPPPPPPPPPPPQVIKTTGSVTRSIATNKRSLNSEISSTTISTRAKAVSNLSLKRQTAPSRSPSTKSKSTKKRKTKSRRKTSEEDENEDDETEEDEEEEVDEEENEDDAEDDEEEFVVNKLRLRSTKKTAPIKSNKKQNQANVSETVSSTSIIQLDEDEQQETNSNSESRLPPPTIGARVIAMYQGAQRTGHVISVNDRRSMFKMRFDDFPSAKFDYSFSYKSSDWSYVGQPPPEISTDEIEPLSTISKKFKALIKFMLPPEWSLTRDEISAMSFDELSQFDVDTFMQSYREKMMKIVEQRKSEETRWKNTALRIQSQVTQLLNSTGMSIQTGGSIEDFEEQVQTYVKRYA